MSGPVTNYAELAKSISARIGTLRTSTPEVMKGFNDLGRAATADGVLDKKTKELIALALSVAARCDPCIAFHTQALVKLGATRQELDETLGVTTYMGGGPSLMYAANAVAAIITAPGAPIGRHPAPVWLRVRMAAYFGSGHEKR